MKPRLIYLGTGTMLALILLLSSCQASVQQGKGETVIGKVSQTEKPQEQPTQAATSKTRAVSSDEPQYGGDFRICLTENVLGFDEAFTVPWSTFTLRLTNSELLMGDWAKGPAGTGNTNWLLPNWPADASLMTGALAESWELTDPTTYTFHLRRGVTFANSGSEAAKLVNGRELTAADYVYSAERLINNKGFYYNITFGVPSERPTFSAPDKYTLVMKLPSADRTYLIEHFGDKACVVPKEVIDKYGDIRDWKVSVGSGPFMLTDCLMESSITFKRNTSFWMNDPLHPNNKLPYVDSVRMLVMTDQSTRIAALRTGKVDQLYPVTWEQAADIMKTNPDMQNARSLSTTSPLLYMRSDVGPTADIKVRRALSMAVDRESIKKDYYGGNAEIFHYLVAPLPDFKAMFTPIDQLPATTKELFEYHPDKAKQLLAEAGYPNGLKLECLCYSAQQDILAIVKDSLAKAGVEMVFNMKEYSVYVSTSQSKGFKDMVYQGNSWATDGPPGYRLTAERWPSVTNYSMQNDQYINDAYTKMLETYLDTAKRQQIMKDVNLYYLDKAFSIQLPCPYQYCMWQPWVRNYHGEYSVGFWNQFGWSMYTWIDQDIKKGITDQD